MRRGCSCTATLMASTKVRKCEYECVGLHVYLTYSFPLFNETTEEGSHNGYPKFIEQNKNDGTSFGSEVTGAQIVYCSDIGAWVFNHPYILTSSDGEEENECSWLWRSQETDDYELTSTSGSAWEAWVGKVKPLVFVSITCNECYETSDCNYHGTVSQ